MSNLKYMTVAELSTERQRCEDYIDKLKSSLSGQKERLKWIDKYIHEKTPQELSISEIERRLGHKVILKGDY